jgi:hypothetical protein
MRIGVVAYGPPGIADSKLLCLSDPDPIST